MLELINSNIINLVNQGLAEDRSSDANFTLPDFKIEKVHFKCREISILTTNLAMAQKSKWRQRDLEVLYIPADVQYHGEFDVLNYKL